MKTPLLLFLLMSFSGCRMDHVASGQVDTSGNQTIIVDATIRIDISGCMALPEYDRLECVKAVTETLKEFTDVAKVLFCWSAIERESGNEGTDPVVTCGDLLSVENGYTGT